jgi:hypothetical protein
MGGVDRRYAMTTRKEIYVRHYIKQSYGWNQVAEYACETQEQAERVMQEARERNPSDESRFDVR